MLLSSFTINHWTIFIDTNIKSFMSPNRPQCISTPKSVWIHVITYCIIIVKYIEGGKDARKNVQNK